MATVRRPSARERDYHRCPSCGEIRHIYMFPFVDPDAYSYPRRGASPQRVAAYARKRREAQAKGRDMTRCIPCQNGDT